MLPRSRALITAVLTIAAAALAACSSGPMHRDHSFTTRAYVTAAAAIDQDAAVRRGIDQIIARGLEAGLVLEETSDRRVVLTSTTATPGGAAPESTAINDTRRVVARATFHTTRSGIEYQYHISLRGSRPDPTNPAHEKAVVAGLFMVRQVFERPLDVDLDAIRTAK
jgi:hypothetical protein